jgi:malonate transporter
VAGVYLLCALVMVAARWRSRAMPRIGWNDAAFGALVAAFPNTGFMGVPLLVALLGAQSAGPAISPSWSTWSSPARCALRCRAWTARVRTAWAWRCKSAFKGMATNPMPWSIALGALASALQFQLPGPVENRGHAGRRRLARGAVHHRRRAGALANEPARTGAGARLRAHGLAKLLVHPLLVWWWARRPSPWVCRSRPLR